jgi:hypothetical protein
VRKRTGYLPWLRRREDAPFRDDRLRGGHIGMAVIFRLLDAMRTSSTGSSTSCSGYCRSRWRSRHSRLYRSSMRRVRSAMLFWALLASGQITMRKVDGWQTLAEKPDDQIIDLAA